MGISRLTVLHIQGNEPFVYTVHGNGKFGFVIGTFHIDPLISSECVYDSAESANEEGNKVLDQLKNVDPFAESKCAS